MELDEKVFEVRLIIEDINPKLLKELEKEGVTLRDAISQLIAEKFGFDQEIGYSVEVVGQ